MDLPNSPQVLFVLGLAVPIIIRKADQIHLQYTMHPLSTIPSEESADANLGNHIQKTPGGEPLPTSYLFNLVSQSYFLVFGKG